MLWTFQISLVENFIVYCLLGFVWKAKLWSLLWPSHDLIIYTLFKRNFSLYLYLDVSAVLTNMTCMVHSLCECLIHGKATSHMASHADSEGTWFEFSSSNSCCLRFYNMHFLYSKNIFKCTVIMVHHWVKIFIAVWYRTGMWIDGQNRTWSHGIVSMIASILLPNYEHFFIFT